MSDTQPTYEEIAVAAYYIWQVKTEWDLAGNTDLANWYEGERLLEAQYPAEE